MSRNEQHSNRRRVSRRSLLASLGATSAVSFAGCSQLGIGGGDGSSNGSSNTVIWAGSDAGVDGLMARVARDTDFDKENGVSVEVKSMSASSLEAAIAQGQVESGNMSPQVAGRVNNNSANNKLQCYRPFYQIHEQIVLHPNIAGDVADDIEGGLGDLRDYKIGSLGEGSSVYNIFELLVTQYGYNVDDYDLRFLDPSAMVQQMIQGNLDAILSFDPPSSKLLARDEGFEILFEYSKMWEDSTGYPLAIGEAVTYHDKIQNAPEKWKALNQMWNDVGAHIKKNTGQVLEKYRDHLGLENEAELNVAKDRMSNLFYDSWNEEARKGQIELVKQSVEAGTVEQPDMDTLFIRPEDL